MAQVQTQIINSVYVPVGASAVYQSPSASTTKISQMVINNNSASDAQTVDIYLCPTDTTPTSANLLESKTLAIGESYMVYKAVNQTIPPSGIIAMSCPTPNTVSVQASGLVIT